MLLCMLMTKLLSFFMNLEQCRVSLLCQSNLNNMKADLLVMAMATVRQSKDLVDKWVDLFEDKSDRN